MLKRKESSIESLSTGGRVSFRMFWCAERTDVSTEVCYDKCRVQLRNLYQMTSIFPVN